MKSIKVRFNLGKGKNYMKWKIEYPNGNVEYHSPSEVQLTMFDCTLKNYKKVASKIYNGSNKEVCAWVLCKDINIKQDNFLQADLIGTRVKYNPRVTPNWVMEDNNVDGEKLNKLISVDFGLYNIK